MFSPNTPRPGSQLGKQNHENNQNASTVTHSSRTPTANSAITLNTNADNVTAWNQHNRSIHITQDNTSHSMSEHTTLTGGHPLPSIQPASSSPANESNDQSMETYRLEQNPLTYSPGRISLPSNLLRLPHRLENHTSTFQQQISPSWTNSVTSAINELLINYTRERMRHLAAVSNNNSNIVPQNIAPCQQQALPMANITSGQQCASPFSSRATTAKILSLERDDLELSSYQCLVRKQIELFECSERNNLLTGTIQGRNRPVVAGQVGIRCRHCGAKPQCSRAKGAVLFPSTLLGLYQAAQNMANSHLVYLCTEIPQDIRDELRRIRSREKGKKTRKSAHGGGRHYWADSLRILGVVETADRRLRFSG